MIAPSVRVGEADARLAEVLRTMVEDLLADV
jgi:hypothetical protein